MIWDELGELTAKQKQLVSVLEVAKLGRISPMPADSLGVLLRTESPFARAFVTKMVYNMATTRILLDRLESDPTIRRLCGWERKEDVPNESSFSRAFDEFAKSRLPERVHQVLIEQHLGGQKIVRHISCDSTAINAREKPEKKRIFVEKETKRSGAAQKRRRTPQRTYPAGTTGSRPTPL